MFQSRTYSGSLIRNCKEFAKFPRRACASVFRTFASHQMEVVSTINSKYILSKILYSNEELSLAARGGDFYIGCILGPVFLFLIAGRPVS